MITFLGRFLAVRFVIRSNPGDFLLWSFLIINSVSPGQVCLSGGETGNADSKECVKIWLWVGFRFMSCGMKVWDKYWPNRLGISVPETTHDSSSLRRGSRDSF